MAEFKIEDYIKSLNLQTDDEKKAAELLFAKPERVEEVKRGWNSVSEGSRLVTEAQTAKAAAEAAQRKAADDAAANKAWFDSLKKYESDSEDAKAKKTAYEAYLTDVGIPLEAALSGNGVTPPARKVEAPVADTKMLDEQRQFQAQVTATAQLLADIPFELQAISNKHFQLYGTVPPPDVMSALKGKFLDPNNKQPLMEIASADLHFSAREKQLADADLEKRVEQMLAEKTTAWESAHKLPTGALSAAEVEPAVNMTSDKFASEVKRSSDNDVNRVSDQAMAAFLATDAELAGAGIRMTQ
jgi:hypothetical protein